MPVQVEQKAGTSRMRASYRAFSAVELAKEAGGMEKASLQAAMLLA